MSESTTIVASTLGEFSKNPYLHEITHRITPPWTERNELFDISVWREAIIEAEEGGFRLTERGYRWKITRVETQSVQEGDQDYATPVAAFGAGFAALGGYDSRKG